MSSNGTQALEPPVGTRFVRAASLADLEARGALAVTVEGHAVALFHHQGRVYAVANACPHMGFPLIRGTVEDGILTCHWHHARFDLQSGGSFDLWADDVRAYPVEVRDGQVYVDPAPRRDPYAHQRRRLQDGLEHDLPLVVAKAVLGMLDHDPDPVAPFRMGLEFGTRYRRAGWGQGLTIHTCMIHLFAHLDSEDRPRALYHGLVAVARDADQEPPRFTVRPLPGAAPDLATLKGWFRRFVAVRDAEGAERCIVSAVRAGADHRAMAEMLFAAATDYRYIDGGHTLDFINKAFEALDHAGWEHAEATLASLARGLAGARRMEESNAWRNPVDVVAICRQAFDRLPVALAEGDDARRARGAGAAHGRALVPVLLGDDPAASAEALLDALRAGCPPDELAGAVAYAAALRIARFPTSNEFGDWDTALHTFTFANAVHQGLRRVPSPDLVRGVFDAAMSVYLDRFLNVPPARLPEGAEPGDDAGVLLAELPGLLDRQQQVNEAGNLVARYLAAGGERPRLLATLGRLLLREDRNFHTIQMIEAAFAQHALWVREGSPEALARADHVLIAAARYLAAHAPTLRAQGQTYEIARRLHRGERIYEEE